ncbi:putative signal transduction histidine kinase [Variovorax paradoxus B4]|uniref:histidine kinase n=1 Tax=Variovorax paradoxus B4 TaxID=1246301 RepID=T1XM79_VARPD|nr:ATP-binding protein [Variovorax paradoxus]AGU53703.1 putative signal transduction histidine kinase [Variovorax paradoxus B4]
MSETATLLRPGAQELSSKDEIARLHKIIQALMDRAERSANAQGSDFNLFQTTIMLEEQVLSRTAELEAALRENEQVNRVLRKTQADLVAAARSAGMAEIATNVLHNVGNVLNSVNVSAGLILSRVRASKVEGLARTVQLMSEHAGDLGTFLASDAKGRMLPGYLMQLTPLLVAEQRAVVDELVALGKSVDHIKEIIAAQQAHAGASSLVESIRVHELVEDALRMNAGGLARHQVVMQSDLARIPELPLDRGRVLQVLMNLVRNARQAMEEAADDSAKLMLNAEIVGDEMLRIRVADTGVGIAPENLTRVFVHGFTTKKDGHGFGLHSAAIAAREMGGTLAVHSDGPGTGATFTLELPIRKAAETP